MSRPTRPTWKPAFTEALQIGIVVCDLEATIGRYEGDNGTDPWEFTQIDLGEANNYREYGQPEGRSIRIATAMVGQYEISPLRIGAMWRLDSGRNDRHQMPTLL